mmetsp:Transcript_20038/g.56579  ORF Transcript_20038/g.56579 Transcript_20038/m.56579 type:complete len:282 (-) Transcript_20038:21-866(-)
MARWLQQQLGISPGPMECLERVEAIKIKERVRTVEAVTAILGQEVEMANKYQVYALHGVDDLFYAVEKTSFLGRNLKQCFSACAPWNLDLLYSQGLGKEPAFYLERPGSWGCCCFDRPSVLMTDVKGSIVGSLQDNSMPCGPFAFSVQDPDGEEALKLQGGLCTCGFWLPLPCGPCSTVELTITEGASGREVGKLQKTVPSYFTFLVAPDVDNYKVYFEGVTSGRHRALLMATAIFLDFEYFNDNTNDDSMRQGIMGSLRQRLFGSDETPRESMMQAFLGR